MTPPGYKRIGELTISVSSEGWPHWTRVELHGHGAVLNEEEAHDLYYALGRIVAYLDYKQQLDTARELKLIGRGG